MFKKKATCYKTYLWYTTVSNTFDVEYKQALISIEFICLFYYHHFGWNSWMELLNTLIFKVYSLKYILSSSITLFNEQFFSLSREYLNFFYCDMITNHIFKINRNILITQKPILPWSCMYCRHLYLTFHVWTKVVTFL